MQVWSDSRAVEDYKNLLAGKAPADTTDCASVIIGAGKVGTALADMGLGDDVVLRRGDAIPAEITDGEGNARSSFPIYVAVRERDLEAVLKACPDDKRADLVFLQGGCVEPLLKRYGACSKDQTQAVLWWTFEAGSARPIDGEVSLGLDSFGEPKVAGQTSVCGKWAGALKGRLARGGLPCETMFYNDWRRVMFERLIFQSAFNLVGALHGYPTVGYVARYYTQEVDDLIYELGRSLRSTIAVTMLLGIEERLMTYAQEMEDKTPTTMDPEDFEWRNGFFYRHVTTPARRAKFPDPCEQHSLYLEYGRDNGLLTIPELDS
ncbi:hypothetical protein JKP88DRAFT_260250 [Tribonema minus]|uniref:2-dehydropantoate 2-reductase n=1 Tax=Tribonema minus TaxID=303371 RepID=A0A836CIC7_9STRA|nr:hypothetical protein JKP88DRAFT_260250 [Tribonema minus]